MQKSTSGKASASPASLDEALRLFRQKAATLSFGTLTLTIHEGRITQLEVNEKHRFSS